MVSAHTIQHCSMFHRTLDIDVHIHYCENRAHIQRLTSLGPHTIEITHELKIDFSHSYINCMCSSFLLPNCRLLLFLLVQHPLITHQLWNQYASFVS